jgi:hypothetical protein
MKTPAGTECKYFYGDYYRGREHEECRLLGATWTRDLCRTCPVPSIGRANACEFMVLNGEVTRPLAAAFQRRVKVTTYCEKTAIPSLQRSNPRNSLFLRSFSPQKTIKYISGSKTKNDDHHLAVRPR